MKLFFLSFMVGLSLHRAVIVMMHLHVQHLPGIVVECNSPMDSMPHLPCGLKFN